MSLAALQRFGPLLSLANKRAGELTDSDLGQVATALAGEGGAALLPFLNILRSSEPEQAVTEILSSPTAKELLEKVANLKNPDEGACFIKCPHCERLSEISLS